MLNDFYKQFKSGTDIRGVAVEGVEGQPVNLTDEVVGKMAKAFLLWLSQKTGKKPSELKLAVGHDSRISADRIRSAVVNAMVDCGAKVLDCGLSSTPSMFMITLDKQLDGSIQITATVVRVPVVGGHSEAVNVETERPFEIEEVRRLLAAMPSVVVQDDPAHNLYPMAITSFDKDEVFVGRIRRDFSVANGLNLWIVSDNIRKGAATNAVQIAQYIIRQYFKQ